MLMRRRRAPPRVATAVAPVFTPLAMPQFFGLTRAAIAVFNLTMQRSAKTEAQFVVQATDLADARRRFAEVVTRASELIVEEETKFWDAFVACYREEPQPDGSATGRELRAKFSEEIGAFVRRKDRP